MKDALGQRMKENYEYRYKSFLPRRTYSIIRLDGKAFHTLTKHMKRPYDDILADAMSDVTIELCKEIQGCKFGYTQSDEISLLLTDFDDNQTQAYFDGNIQKIVSISASIAAAVFNKSIGNYSKKLAYFDSRVFIIPDSIEVENYFIWRSNDCTRNSISMLAQSLYSHKELHKKSSAEMQEICFLKGKNWNDVEDRFKRGSLITKEQYKINTDKGISLRNRWVANAAFDFLKEREKLSKLIPKYQYNY